MNVLAQSALLGALGGALLHSLWQMGLLWLFYVVLTGNGQRFSARQRYNLALFCTLFGSVLFIFTIVNQLYAGSDASLFDFIQSDAIAFIPGIRPGEFFQPALPFLSGMYLLIVGYLFLRFFRQYYYTHRLINAGLKKAAPEIRLFLQEATVQLGIHRKIRLGFSDLISSPLTVGFWKPVILLPMAIACHLSIEQTEAIILHELNHIRKNDYLVNLLLATIDIILFFNPFSRLLSAALVRERENSCDDLVLQFKYKPAEYARALLLLEQHRAGAIPALAVSAMGSGRNLLLNRVQRILHGKAPMTLPGARVMLILFFTFLLGAVGLIQSENIPQSFAINRPPEQNTQTSEVITPFTTSTLASPQEEQVSSVAYKKPIILKKVLVSPAEEESIPAEVASENDKTLETNYITEVVNLNDGIKSSGAVSAVVVPDRDYSIDISKSSNLIEATGVQATSVPYIPSGSFSYIYQINSDTTFPSRFPISESELNGRRELEKAIATLENLDMNKLEKGIGASALQLKRLEAQLKKTLQSDEWHKMSKDLQANYKAVQNQLRMKQAYLAQLGQYAEAQSNYSQLQQTDKQQKIVLDRIMENQQLQKAAEEKQKTELKKAKVKKVVVI